MTTVVQRLKLGDKAPDITVSDFHGQPVSLAAFWPGGPTLVNFLRHFGCLHCRARLAQLEQHHADLRAVGLQVVTLALGEPKHAERYCGRLAPSLTCFADDKNDGYYAWGLRQGTARELLAESFNILKASAKAVAAGHVQGAATGDPHMLPGTFIVDRGGFIRYAYYSRYAGDDPAIATLLAEARQLKANV